MQGNKLQNIGDLVENKYTKFEDFTMKQGKYNYTQDEIIIEKLRNERLEAVKLSK